MKLHLPLGLRAALLSVLAYLSTAHANTFRMAGHTNQDVPANGEYYYNWDPFWKYARTDNPSVPGTVDSSYFAELVTININTAAFTLNNNVTFRGGAVVNVTEEKTFTLRAGYLGYNSNSALTVNDGSTFTMAAASETSTYGAGGIGYGEESTENTITLTNGSTFNMNDGHIVRNKAQGVITIDATSTFNLRNGYIGSESGSGVTININGGTFNMSGGRIGDSLVRSKGQSALINVGSGATFRMSGGYLGYSGSVDLTVEAGGTMILGERQDGGNGDFSESRGALNLAGNGKSGASIENGGNAALFVNTAIKHTVRMDVTVGNEETPTTTFNIYGEKHSIAFASQFTFGGRTLNKVGQGQLIFTDWVDPYNSKNVVYFGTAEEDSGTININRGVVKLDYANEEALAGFSFNLIYAANVVGTLWAAEGGSYVVQELGGSASNDEQRGQIIGGGTLIINYSGENAATSAANVAADERFDSALPSLVKRGSGEQQITGTVSANGVTVSEGTLSLGSAGHSVTMDSLDMAQGATLRLDNGATTGSLSGAGGSIRTGGTLTIGQVEEGAQLTDITLADGSTLDVRGGTLSSGSTSFSGDGTGTLNVNLTNETHLDFAAFAHGSLTLTLTDTYLSFGDGYRYQLFAEDSYRSEWGENITLSVESIGRKQLAFDQETGAIIVSGNELALRWQGANLTWQDAAGATSEWLVEGATDSATDRFMTGDAVIFDNAAGAAVTLSGAITTKSVEIADGVWNFTGGSGLHIVEDLTVTGGGASLGVATKVSGNVINENGGQLDFTAGLDVAGYLSSNGALTLNGNGAVGGTLELSGGTGNLTGSSLTVGGRLNLYNTEARFGYAELSAASHTTISNSSVEFSGGTVDFLSLTVEKGSSVTFSGTGLTLGNYYHDISGSSEVHLALDLSALASTTSSTAGYILSKYIRVTDAGSRFVVHGYVNDADMTAKYRQNYNIISGAGTLVMLDTGYQVHNGETPAVSQEGNIYGDGILSRFLSRTSTVKDTDRIHALELASSQGSAHPTVIVFNTYTSYAGYLLKHVEELHVTAGAALGFTFTSANDGPRGMWNTYAPNLILHLAGAGTGSGYERTGSNAALFVSSETTATDSAVQTVTVPWRVMLDADTTINTVTAGAGLLLTNELTNTEGYTLTKAGYGTLTLGSGFCTAAGSRGAISAQLGGLTLSYGEAATLRSFGVLLGQNTTLTLSGGSYEISHLGNSLNNSATAANRSRVTGSGTLAITLETTQSTAYSDFVETAAGERVSLEMRGAATQTIAGNLQMQDVTVAAGTLILGSSERTVDVAGAIYANGGTLTLNGTATAAQLAGSGGELNVQNKLSVSSVANGAELGALTVAENGTLALGGGTLSGRQLNLGSAATLNVSLAGETRLHFQDIDFGGQINLELADLYVPGNLRTDAPYQLFDAETWDPDWEDQITLVTTEIGRMTVGFEGGAIVVKSGERAELTWTGGTSLVWQAEESTLLNWQNNATSTADYFYNGDNVTFDNATGGSITVSGVVSAGEMHVAAGAWNFSDTGSSSLAITGKLTLADGAGAVFATASAALENGAAVGDGATLSFTGATAKLHGQVDIAGGTLTLAAGATSLSGDIVAESGSILITAGAVSSTGSSITLGKEDGSATADLSVSATGAKALGDITVHTGSLALVQTAAGWQAQGTRISGAGTLQLHNLGFQAIGSGGGALANFISTTAAGAEAPTLGSLKLSGTGGGAGTALGFNGAGEELTHVLERVDEIQVTAGTALGFTAGGGEAFAGTTGVLRLAGSGTGSSTLEEGGNAALFVGSMTAATMPWDVVLEGAVALNPIAPSSSLTLTGALTAGDNVITKNGQGSLILSDTFTTKPAAGSSGADAGTLAIYRGTLTLDYSDETALQGYTIALARGNTPIGTLNAEEGGRYVIKGVNNAVNYEGGEITGGGTLAIDTAGASFSTTAEVVGGALTLEKKGAGEQSIAGNVSAAAITVTEGTLTLGGKDKVTTVSGAVKVEGTLAMGNNLTLGTLSGAGCVSGGSAALTLSGDAGAFTGDLDTRGSWTLTGTSGADVELYAGFTGSGSILLDYAEAETLTLTGAAKDSISLDHGGSAKLTLTGQSTSSGALILHGNAAQLGTADAAAAWAGDVRNDAAGAAELTLVHGSLGKAFADANTTLRVEALGAVQAGGTAGSAFSSIAIREGGRLTGVTGDISVSATGTSMELTFGSGNLGAAGQSLIESGDITVAAGGVFLVDFTSQALVDILKMKGEDVSLSVVSGGTLDLGDIATLEEIVKAGGYGELLLAYNEVEAEGGAIILHAKEEEKDDPPVVDPDDPPVVDPDDPPVVDPDDPPVVDPDDPPVVDPDDPPVVDPDDPPVVDPDDPPVVDPDDPPVVDPDDPPVVDPDDPPVVNPDDPPAVDPDDPPAGDQDDPPVGGPEPERRVYLVLADGSADADSVTDYRAMEHCIATVLDAETRLKVELGDDSLQKNTFRIKNLVGLEDTMLIVRSTGEQSVTLELNNELQDVDSSATLPDGMAPEAARGIDTEFEGLIVGEAGVNFLKTGAGTLTIGSKTPGSSHAGGMQVEGDVEIREGAIVIRGGGKSSMGSISFNYADGAGGMQRSLTPRGLVIRDASVSTAAIRELSDEGAAISLQQQGELILTGNNTLQNTSINADNSGGKLTVENQAELTLDSTEGEREALSGVAVSVTGGGLRLQNGASMNGGALRVADGGQVSLSSGSGLTVAEVNVQNGALEAAAGSKGVHATGGISLAKKAELHLGEGTSSSAGGLTGSGVVYGSKGAALAISGSGSVFSGSLSGEAGSTISVEKGADLTLEGIHTTEGSQWDAQVRAGGTLTVDVTKSELDTALGDITLANTGRLIYKLDTENTARMSGNIVLEEGAQAEFIIEAKGRTIQPGEDFHLGGLTYGGSAEALHITLQGKGFAYFNGTLYWDQANGGLLTPGYTESSASNKLLRPGMEANARAGAKMYWAALDPAGCTWDYLDAHEGGELDRFLDALYDSADASRELAAGAGSALSTLAPALAEDLHRQLNALRNRATTGDLSRRGVWVSGETSYHKLDAEGLAPGYTLDGWGGSMGIDAPLGRHASAGLSLTAMYNDLKPSAADEVKGDMDTQYVSAYARVKYGAWMHTFIATAGTVDATLKRTVRFGEDSYTTHGSTDGYALGAMYEVGYTWIVREQGTLAVQPVAHVEVRHAALNGYTETGSDAGLRMADSSMTMVTLGLGLRMQGMGGQQALNRAAVFETRLMLKADVGDRRGSATNRLIHGDTAAQLQSAEVGALGVEIGAGASVPVSRDASIFVDVSTELRSGYTTVGAAAGVKVGF